MKIIKPTKQNITEVVDILNRGGVVVCPTDTVYGFLALAENKKAVEKIFKIKKRSKKKTLPIFVYDLKMAKEVAEISKVQEKVLKSKWPGKYTFILKSKNILKTPGIIRNKTVALRIPKYKFLNDLLNKINKPLAQTSVNISENPVLIKMKDIIEVFDNNKNIDLIIDVGNLKKAKPSRVIDLISIRKRIIRS